MVLLEVYDACTPYRQLIGTRPLDLHLFAN